MRSSNLWSTRYTSNPELGSGAGSKGKLLEFKTEFINSFVLKNEINSLIDFGHGDLSVANLLNVKSYVGVDIFDAASYNVKGLHLVKKRFDEFEGNQAELVICLDVLYHILEEEQDYLRKSIDKMIESCTRFLIIYAHDSTEDHDYTSHLYDSKWLQYCLKKRELNLIFQQKECEPGTSAKFFVFKKI